MIHDTEELTSVNCVQWSMHFFGWLNTVMHILISIEQTVMVSVIGGPTHCSYVNIELWMALGMALSLVP